ncbi:hypothetical protein Gpo141_00003875 [Globisporangium polare]
MSKRFANPFPPLQLTPEDATQLEGLAHAFIRSSMEQYERFAFDKQYEVDERRWKHVMQRENVQVFAERREKDILSGVDLPDAPVTSTTGADLPTLLLCGTIAGKLDDAIFGYVCPTLDWMRIKTSYIDDQLVGSAVLKTLVRPSPDDPFRSLTIKWIEKGRPLHVRAISKNRDFVYMESTGVDTLSNGERIGYHLIHSVQFPQTPELDTVVRGNMSVSGIYRQRTHNQVDVCIRGVLNPAGGLMRSIVISSAAHALVSSWKYMHCAEMRKLAWLLGQRNSVVVQQKDVVILGGGGSTSSSKDSWGCSTCGKKPSTLSSLVSRANMSNSSRSTCKICLEPLCSSCRLKRTLSFIAQDQRLVQSEITFCAKCVVQAAALDAVEIAKDQLVASAPFSWKDKYASSSTSSSELSPNGSEAPGHFG